MNFYRSIGLVGVHIAANASDGFLFYSVNRFGSISNKAFSNHVILQSVSQQKNAEFTTLFSP